MSIATCTISPSSTAFSADEARAFALDAVAEAFALGTLDRAARKVTNQALFVLGLPTLAGSRTLAEYALTLTATERRNLGRLV